MRCLYCLERLPKRKTKTGKFCSPICKRSYQKLKRRIFEAEGVYELVRQIHFAVACWQAMDGCQCTPKQTRLDARMAQLAINPLVGYQRPAAPAGPVDPSAPLAGVARIGNNGAGQGGEVQP